MYGFILFESSKVGSFNNYKIINDEIYLDGVKLLSYYLIIPTFRTRLLQFITVEKDDFIDEENVEAYIVSENLGTGIITSDDLEIDGEYVIFNGEVKVTGTVSEDAN